MGFINTHYYSKYKNITIEKVHCIVDSDSRLCKTSDIKIHLKKRKRKHKTKFPDSSITLKQYPEGSKKPSLTRTLVARVRDGQKALPKTLPCVYYPLLSFSPLVCLLPPPSPLVSLQLSLPCSVHFNPLLFFLAAAATPSQPGFCEPLTHPRGISRVHGCVVYIRVYMEDNGRSVFVYPLAR